MGIGPIAKWRRVSIAELFAKLKYIMLLGIALGVIIPLAIYGSTTVMTAVGIAAGAWAIITSSYAIIRLLAKRDSSTSLGKALSKIPRAMFGMAIAHTGIGIFIFGVVLTNAFSEQKEVAVTVGSSVQLVDYTFTLEGVSPTQGPNYQAMRGFVNVEKNGEIVAKLFPEKRVYTVQRNPMTEAGIQSGVFRDLYVALGEAVSSNEWGLRVYYRPFVQWIWFGALLMAIGGLVGAMDRRYRSTSVRNSESQSASVKSSTAAT